MMSKLTARSWIFVSVIAVLALVVASCRVTPATTTVPAPAVGADLSVVKPAGTLGQQLELRNDMRRLWEDHVVFTRLAVTGIVLDLPDVNASVERLLQNQVETGDAIKPFYGEDAGNTLTGLLTEHVMVAADLVKAVKAGDDMTIVSDLQGRWNSNADEIATFLNSANPIAWRLPEVSGALRAHLGLALDEAQAVLNGDWKASIDAFDRNRMNMLNMADVLSAGIISQFPDKFMVGTVTPSEPDPFRSIY